MDVSVWKSNSAVVILDVVGGTITVGETEYEIKLGYALYVNHNVLKSSALVMFDSSAVLALRLQGVAGEAAGLATAAGRGPVELSFDCNASSRNSLGGWTLVLDGNLRP